MRTRSQNLAAAAAEAAQSRSRFVEGSMKDRASAAPPVAFLGGGTGGGDAAWLETPVPTAATMATPRQGGRMRLGLVWEGVRGRLRMRNREAPAAVLVDDDDEGRVPGAGLPSREEALASYQRLVAEGFFAERAIHATRRPATAHGGRRVGDGAGQQQRQHQHQHHQQHQDQQQSQQWQQTPPQPRRQPPPAPPNREAPPPPPQWPLQPASPMTSPLSTTSSRGTKRPATTDMDEALSPASPGEDGSTLAHRFLPKRLRRSPSRDMSLPRVRAARRTMSSATSRRPRRLTRLALPVTAPTASASASASAREQSRGGGARNLRPRIVGGPLSVVPDANRGIPRVPAIPEKFARAGEQDDDEATVTL